MMKNEKLVVKVTREEKEKILEFIEDNVLNLSALVRKLLREYMEQHQKKKK